MVGIDKLNECTFGQISLNLKDFVDYIFDKFCYSSNRC